MLTKRPFLPQREELGFGVVGAGDLSRALERDRSAGVQPGPFSQHCHLGGDERCEALGRVLEACHVRVGDEDVQPHRITDRDPLSSSLGVFGDLVCVEQIFEQGGGPAWCRPLEKDAMLGGAAHPGRLGVSRGRVEPRVGRSASPGGGGRRWSRRLAAREGCGAHACQSV